MKKKMALVLVAVLLTSIAATALAGYIVTPNGGRAILWKNSTSSGSEYVAYISSGNSATLKNSSPSNGRYYVSAYGYNSSRVYGYYNGWINAAYYYDQLP